MGILFLQCRTSVKLYRRLFPTVAGSSSTSGPVGNPLYEDDSLAPFTSVELSWDETSTEVVNTGRVNKQLNINVLVPCARSALYNIQFSIKYCSWFRKKNFFLYLKPTSYYVTQPRSWGHESWNVEAEAFSALVSMVQPFLPSHCGKFETNAPRIGIARPHSQFTHSCVCERFIYSQVRSAYSAAGKYEDRSREYTNRSQTHECGECDSGGAIPFLGIHK